MIVNETEHHGRSNLGWCGESDPFGVVVDWGLALRMNWTQLSTIVWRWCSRVTGVQGVNQGSLPRRMGKGFAGTGQGSSIDVYCT